MKHNFIFWICICLFTSFSLLAQDELKIGVRFLANDKIAPVNVNQDKYIKNVSDLVDIMRREFKDIPADQKVALVVVCHKVGNPTLEFYSRPKVSGDREQRFLKEVNNLKFENTKFVDFPLVLSANVVDSLMHDEFKEIVFPLERARTEYEKADLVKKYELNKAWAANEVLPVLSAFQVIVDDKFAGVKNFGTLVSKTNFNEPQNVYSLTSANNDYWRAVLEMSVGNQMIPVTKIFAYVSQGEFDHALKYLEVVQIFSNPKTNANDYLDELAWRLRLFNKQLGQEIGKGITEHDKGNYKKAIAAYDLVLKNYPNSAWALYEKYFSQNALDLKEGKVKTEDREDWDKAKVNIYKSNPLYSMDVRAGNAREGYLLFRRQEVSSLFKDKAERLKDIYQYADIALDLGIYDFAAQLFWYSYTYSKGENEKALKKFLYCLEKLGTREAKENFKFDHAAEFKKIEEEKDKEMKESIIYKSFAK
ncbi:MAG: hypothetical protein V4635_04205 [Bacteroidota bacterium]